MLTKWSKRSADMYQRSYLGMSWEPTPEQTQLRKWAAEYCAQTALHYRNADLSLLQANSIRLVGVDSRQMCVIHATDLRESMYAEIRRLGFSRSEWHKAIETVSVEIQRNNQ